jgi:probable rRNA maturation factor
LSNQQSEIPLRVRPLRQRLERALKFLPRPLPEALDGIEFVLVDRAIMARVHANFLGDPTETDVITFPYGEIVICPAVAKEQAATHETNVEDEVLLYGLHGLLHLAGYDDLKPAGAKEMALAQEKLLRKVLKASR